MTQYVMFQSTPEIEEAIRVEYVLYLTPNKVYELIETYPEEQIIDDSGCLIHIVTVDWDFNCLQLHNLAQWQYCDVDGNIL